jgi:2-haloalkanoic acid dehalogenase type II
MKTILFDLDDTLFDHRHASLQSLAAIREAHTPLQSADLPALETIYRDRLERTHLEVLRGTVTKSQARVSRWQQVFAHFEADLAEEQAHTIAQLARTIYQSHRQVVAGTVEVLATLRERGYAIGIVTNNITAEQVEKLAHCQIDHLVDALITAEDAKAIKPDPRIFQVALEKLNTTAAEAVMVGDSWASDVLGAQGVGMRAIWLNRYDEPCPNPALATEIRDLSELLDLCP